MRGVAMWPAGVLLVVGACTAIDGVSNDQLPVLTPAQWREDVRYFAKELPRRHANAFHATPREQFDAAIARLEADLPTLQSHQVAVRLQQITAAVGDLHTYVRLPSTLPRYPLTLYWFGHELRIVGAIAAYREAMGARVTSINGIPIAEVQRRIATVLSRMENDWFVLGASPRYIVIPAVLHTLDILPDPARAAFGFQRDDGTEGVIEVEPLVPSAGGTPEMLTAAASEPLFRQRPHETFWFVPLPDTQTVYVSFRGYDSLKDHVRKLFQLVDATRVGQLVIDLRDNTGGDYTKVREHLIPAIRARPSLNTRGRLFVITGRRTLSAAMNSAADLRRETNALLAGEPAGERPNSYQEGREMQLPNSRLVVSYSTRYYKFVEADVPAILPDLRIDPSWPAYKAGRDPVLEHILECSKTLTCGRR